MLRRGTSALDGGIVLRLLGHGVLPAVLGLVHQAVGGGEQRIHGRRRHEERRDADARRDPPAVCRNEDRKSTRLNSSHSQISYAVFCLKKKKQISSRSTTFLRSVFTTCAVSFLACSRMFD